MQNVHIQFKPSRQFIFLILLIVTLTFAIICFLSCALWLKLALLSLAFFYSFFILKQYGLLRSQQSVIGLVLDAKGWQLQTKTKSYLVKLCGDSTITRYLCVLRFKKIGQQRKYSCIVFRDSVNCYREFCLRVRESQYADR